MIKKEFEKLKVIRHSIHHNKAKKKIQISSQN